MRARLGMIKRDPLLNILFLNLEEKLKVRSVETRIEKTVEMAETASVRVVARFRPINEREKREGGDEKRDLQFTSEQSCRVRGLDFTMDRVFSDANQIEVRIELKQWQFSFRFVFLFSCSRALDRCLSK